MSFCSHCGEKLNDGAKFCHTCGISTEGISSQQNREQEYAGKVIKCPNCGEPLESFTFKCPACGLELRETKASSSVQEFERKWEDIESKCEIIKPNNFLESIFPKKEKGITKTDAQKIALIKNFPVPNTKEDILEFLILAISNVNMEIYSASDDPVANDVNAAISDAWNVKIKQIYSKAKTIYNFDSDFSKVQSVYIPYTNEMKKQKRKKLIKNTLFYGWIPLLLVITLVLAPIFGPKMDAKEIERLEAIVSDIQEALDNKEFKLALKHADSIKFERFNSELERQWDIKREYWVDKVLEQASINGVYLEYVPSHDEKENNTDESSQDKQ